MGTFESLGLKLKKGEFKYDEGTHYPQTKVVQFYVILF